MIYIIPHSDPESEKRGYHTQRTRVLVGVRHKKRRRESTPAHGKYVENYTVPGHSTTGRRRAREESDDDEI